MGKDENSIPRPAGRYIFLRQDSESPSVKYGTLGLVSVSLAIGFIASIFVFNSDESETVFSVVDLISFTLSVFLSAASIVLAISAIALGKSSENILIKRSDESIRIQNEVFSKTTEALSRIESSTGVTEKRIEDIIAGRAGDISQSIMEQIEGSGKSGDSLDFQAMEEKLRNTIVESIEKNGGDQKVSVDREKMKEKRQQRAEERKKYYAAHDVFFSKLLNNKNVGIVKLPQHGTYGAEGEELLDAIFLVNGERVGVSTHSRQLEDAGRADIYMKFARLVGEGVVDSVCLVFFGDDGCCELIDGASGFGRFIDSKITEKIRAYVAGYDKAEEVVDLIDWL